jgi:hypothetical protein
MRTNKHTDQILTERRIRHFWMCGIVMFAICIASCAAICPISNETNAFAVVSIQTDSNNFVILSFESCTDHVYVVSWTDSLDSNAVWTAAAWMRGNQGTTTWADHSAAGAQQRFYQVLRLAQNDDYSGGGIPNGWAVDNGLDPVDPNVAQEDPDGTGFDNLEEYLMGFYPMNPLSYPGCITNGFSNATNLIYVATNGSDTNSGSAAAPFLTIQMAATTAKTLSQSGTGSTILIMPGTYGESIFYGATSASLLAPVVFSAATNGTVVISGVDVWTNGWTLAAGSTNVYQHSWTNTWGLATLPSGWPTTSNIVKRCEIVLVNGDLLTQVISRAGMKNGTYYVDDVTNHLLYVQHRGGVVVNNAFYEVSQRTNLLTVTQSGSFQVANVVLQGLEFRGGATPLPNSAVQFNTASNILVNACVFDWNNWVGMNFSAGNAITIRDCVANHNGAMGLQAGAHEKNVVSDGNVTCFNNWRGVLGDFLGFSIAGMKALNIHTGLFRNQVAIENQTYGLWFDFDNKNVFVEGCVFSGNGKDGLQFEATEGPVRIQGVVSTRGQGSFGLLCQNIEQMTVTNCAFLASGSTIGSGAIGCSVSTSRAVTDWETGTNYTLYSSNWSLHDNATRSAASTQFGLYMLANFPGFLSTLTSDYNYWYNTGSNPLFTIGGTNYNLSQWQSLSDQDAHSTNIDLQVILASIQDTYLNLDTTTNAFGSATNAICGTQPDGTGMADVALLEFDPSSLTGAPREAELQLAVSAASVSNGPVVFYVYRLTTPWDENATTAQAQPNSSLSWVAGTFSAADYDPQIVGIGMTASGTGLNTFVDITALVQNWVGGVSPNYGVVVIAQPLWNQPVPDGSNLQQFSIGTREAASAQRPQISCLHR